MFVVQSIDNISTNFLPFSDSSYYNAFDYTQLSLFFYLCGDELFLIVNFMAMRRTFEYGLNEHSSMGISGVGMVSEENSPQAFIQWLFL